MTPRQLSRLINDPRGPETVLPTLTAQELSKLLNALYRNLDTPSPALEAETWYELAVEEDLRRSTPTENATRSPGLGSLRETRTAPDATNAST